MFQEYLQKHDLSALLSREARRPFPPESDRARWSALAPEVQAQILRLGDQVKAGGYPMLAATQFMAFTRTGDRQVFEQPYFLRRRRLIHAVLAECVAGDGSYLDAVIDGLWCICEESTWAVSAHNGSSHPGMRPQAERLLPDVENPYIDLFCAQTAGTLCHTLALVGDRLDGVSPLIARRVRRELERRVFLPFLTRDDFWWMGMIRRDVNNWTPWILSNIMDCMLLEMRDRPRLAEGVTRALRMLDSYLAVMPQDGGCDEGAGYWNLAGGALLDCLELLYSASDGRINFYQEPLIRAIGAFPALAHIDGDYYWNFADCDAKPTLDGERLYRYGLRTENPSLMALGVETFDLQRALTLPDTPQMHRLLLSLFATMPTADHHSGDARALARGALAQGSLSPGPACTESPAFIALPALQAFAWRKDGLYLAAKGGHNGESHNHNDVGSFLLYCDGQPEIVDAGNMTYTAITFSDRRYTLWNTRSVNHNLPLVGGAEQCPGREYRALNVRADETGATMELQAAYPAECGLTRFLRTFLVEAEGFAVADELTLEEPKAVEWVFLLRNRPQLAAGELRFGKLRMGFAPELTVRVQELPVDDPRMAKNFPGSLWRVTLTAPPALLHTRRFLITRS